MSIYEYLLPELFTLFSMHLFIYFYSLSIVYFALDIFSIHFLIYFLIINLFIYLFLFVVNLYCMVMNIDWIFIATNLLSSDIVYLFSYVFIALSMYVFFFSIHCPEQNITRTCQVHPASMRMFLQFNKIFEILLIISNRKRQAIIEKKWGQMCWLKHNCICKDLGKETVEFSLA